MRFGEIRIWNGGLAGITLQRECGNSLTLPTSPTEVCT
jgi:hypothetical protein